MKFIFAVLFSCFGTLSVKAQAVLTFERMFTNFDTIPQYTDTTFLLKFTNTGNKPLIITGCTTATSADMCVCDKKPVAPGKSGFIMYKLAAVNCGRWNKSIVVNSNGGEGIVLNVKAFVLCPEKIAPVQADEPMPHN